MDIGVTRIEWGCARNDEGECATICGVHEDAQAEAEESFCSEVEGVPADEHEGERDSMPQPCKDVPVKSGNIKVHAQARQNELPFELCVSVMVAVLPGVVERASRLFPLSFLLHPKARPTSRTVCPFARRFV